MTSEEFALLRTEELRAAIAANRGRDPLEVALDPRVPQARLVATQVKYLARAARKLPAYAAAGCILPPRAFEQASGEACARHKELAGEAVLDLTCGLGVDARALAERFARVVTLERDPVLAAVARENFARLGVSNIEVVTASAEEYLAQPGLRFDWVYADPDRRSPEGRKLVRLEDCAPDILALLPRIRAAAPRLCLKNSPLFDVGEALRLFPRSRVEVVSQGGECKEVVVYDDGRGPEVRAAALGLGTFAARPGEAPPPLPEAFEPARYRWLAEPDAALQKARLVRRHLAGRADCWSDNGYGFAEEEPRGVLGRVFAVASIEPFDARRLKRLYRGLRVEIRRRDFPLAAEELARRLGVRPGSDVRLAFTQAAGRSWTVLLE